MQARFAGRGQDPGRAGRDGSVNGQGQCRGQRTANTTNYALFGVLVGRCCHCLSVLS